MNSHCKKTEDVSAYLDGELKGATQLRFETHLAGCAGCQSMMAELQRLRTCFRSLPEADMGVDLAAVLRARPIAPPSRAAWLRFSWWQLVPLSFTAAATLSLGVFLGSSLLDRHDTKLDVPELAMFDLVPPGSVCIGFFAGCYPPEEI
ncbi:MAG TPA: zf-HC2 domain-containing protein [Thiobacillaceae bacterium]|nr:zf-HC2 domain-containing protein [Thiobacillaceae bacterium]